MLVEMRFTHNLVLYRRMTWTKIWVTCARTFLCFDNAKFSQVAQKRIDLIFPDEGSSAEKSEFTLQLTIFN